MMQSISLDMDDIHGAEDGYLSNEDFPPLAGELPPLSPTRNEADPFGDEDNPLVNGGESDADKENQGDKKRPPRLVNRKPQPKLDATRLCSDRGLPTLSKHFEKVQFKGKGHEVDDLNRLMSTMEHWAHRLFPKMPFDEVIERIEKLGRKMAVQTCVKKIRLDMPIMDEDFVEQIDDEDGNDGMNHGGDDNDEMQGFSQLAGQSSQTTDTPSRLNTSVSLSEEQKERIEQNKRLAMERRRSKGPSEPTGPQGGVSVDELRDAEQNHADEEEMEEELWNDIAMFEASQRNVWKKTPEKPARDSDGPADLGPAATDGKSAESEIVDLTEITLDAKGRMQKEDQGDQRTETIVIDADPSDDETAEEVKDGEEEALVHRDEEGEDIEAQATEEGEGNSSSDLVLKWDSESADESVLETSEKPAETGPVEATSITKEVPKVDEDSAESDKEVTSNRVEEGTRDSPGVPSGGETGEDVLPDPKMDEGERETNNDVMDTVNADTVDETERFVSNDKETNNDVMDTVDETETFVSNDKEAVEEMETD